MEAELVATDKSISKILLTKQFLAHHGVYVPTTTTIYQDNKSTILPT